MIMHEIHLDLNREKVNFPQSKKQRLLILFLIHILEYSEHIF